MAYYRGIPNKYEIINRNTLYSNIFGRLYYKIQKDQIYFYYLYDECTPRECEKMYAIEKDYNHIKPLLSSSRDYGNSSDYAYVLLWNDSGCSCIKELLSKKIILDGFKISQLKIHKIFDEEDWYHSAIKDMLFFVNKLDKNNKIYSIFSLHDGYQFGPYEYSEIDVYENGVILDDKYVVEFTGFVKDVSGYEKIDEENNVYYNKESDRWFILEDADGEFLHYLDDSNYPEIKEADLCDYRYEYNIETKKLKKQQKYISDYDRDYDRDAWDAMTDGQYGDYPGSGWDMESFGY